MCFIVMLENSASAWIVIMFEIELFEDVLCKISTGMPASSNLLARVLKALCLKAMTRWNCQPLCRREGDTYKSSRFSVNFTTPGLSMQAHFFLIMWMLPPEVFAITPSG